MGIKYRETERREEILVSYLYLQKCIQIQLWAQNYFTPIYALTFSALLYVPLFHKIEEIEQYELFIIQN